MVGVAGFELATPCTPCKNWTFQPIPAKSTKRVISRYINSLRHLSRKRLSKKFQ